MSSANDKLLPASDMIQSAEGARDVIESLDPFLRNVQLFVTVVEALGDVRGFAPFSRGRRRSYDDAGSSLRKACLYHNHFNCKSQP
jgi:hypothetical protein